MNQDDAVVVVDGCRISPISQHRLEVEMLAAYQAAAWGNRDGADFSVRACEALAAVIEGPWRRINAQMVERVRSDVRRILSTVTVAELVSDHGTRGPG